jgi:hypothetical protein
MIRPTNIHVSQMMVLCQAAELQALGHLPGVAVDLEQAHESVLSHFLRCLPPQRGKTHESSPMEGNLIAFTDLANRSIRDSLGFVPNMDPHFVPRQVIMEKAGDSTPIVIEKRGFDEARPYLNRKGRAELDSFEILARHESMEPAVFTLRTWDGAVHAMSIGMLTCYDDGMTMLCNRSIKFNRRPRSALRDAGLVLTLARLLYMRARGYWSDAAPILIDIQPPLLASYRKKLTRAPSLTPIDQWGISRSEADFMLIAPPYTLVPLSVEDRTP